MNLNDKTLVPLPYVASLLVFVVGVVVWMYAFFAQQRDVEDMKHALQVQIQEVKQDQSSVKEDIKKILEYTSYIKGKMDKK